MDEENLNKNHEIYFVPGLQRGLEALEIVAEAGGPIGTTPIAKGLGISRSSAFRLIYTLRHMGFLENVPNSKDFALGPRVLSLGFAYLASQSIIELSRRELEILRDSTNVCAHLAVRDGRDVLYLECVQPRTGFLSNVNVGTRMPAHGSPMGWLMLTELSHAEVNALYKDRKLTALTDQTPTDLEMLSHRISKSAANGYVLSEGVVEAGGRSIAAPIYDKSGHIVAAIDISGPESAFEAGRFETFYLAEVLNSARNISLRLGHSGR